jgi:hypothetical protein
MPGTVPSLATSGGRAQRRTTGSAEPPRLSGAGREAASLVGVRSDRLH